MEYLQTAIEFLLHFDKHLTAIISAYGAWAYLFLFLIIFAETGLVVTPFLPGDSLLFMTGAICAQGSLNVINVFILLSAAAILGDSLNYAIGKAIGPKVFKYEKARFFKKEYLDATHRFYERHGPKTIVLARFIPMMRTFAPFVAGIGCMSYGRFFAYNVIGGIIWAALFIFGGFWFGGMPLIKDHFMLFTLFIIFLSLLPVIVKFIKVSLRTKSN
ncbi:MAG: DedA family protein [Candidatus Omnitrophota bacterium]